MKELLKSYQNAYDFKLRLTINGQSVFCGFEGSSLSEVSFLIQEDSLVLECDHEREETLKGIVIALSHVYHKEDLLLKLIHHQATSEDLKKLEAVVSNRSHRLVMMYGQSSMKDVMQMLHHLFEKNVPMTKVDGVVVVLVEQCDEMKQMMVSIKDTLESELYCRVKMMISSVFDQPEKVSDAYRQIQRAQKLMSHYEPSVDVMEAEECWLMDLVDQLPQNQAESLIEQLTNESELDDELTCTALCFLENNLSISATARELYVHRNTLIYRLDKIMQLTGLDLRIFEDAMKFKVLMTLKKK